MHLKEHQEITDKLNGIVSEKTEEISNIQVDLENSNAKLQEKVQELKANEQRLFKLKEEISETQKKMCDTEQLKKEFKVQSLTMNKIEMENLNLAQKLHENLEEMKSVMKERDNLRGLEETLKLERDLLKADLQGSTARVSCPPPSCQIPVFILRSLKIIDAIHENLNVITFQGDSLTIVF